MPSLCTMIITGLCKHFHRRHGWCQEYWTRSFENKKYPFLEWEQRVIRKERLRVGKVFWTEKFSLMLSILFEIFTLEQPHWIQRFLEFLLVTADFHRSFTCSSTFDCSFIFLCFVCMLVSFTYTTLIYSNSMYIIVFIYFTIFPSKYDLLTHTSKQDFQDATYASSE